LLIPLLLQAVPGSAQTIKRGPVPPKALLAKKDQLIRELLDSVWREDYTRAKADAAGKQALAIRLLQEAQDTFDDAAGKYVLLRDAREWAARGGDANTALQALDEMAQWYNVDALDLKVTTLAEVAKGVVDADASKALAQLTLGVIEDALAVDNYEVAGRLLPVAETAARKAKNVPLIVQVKARAKEREALEKEYAEVKKDAAKLAKDPKNPEASLVMGRFYAFYKGNWEKGLLLLRQGVDAKLSGLAQRDLDYPTDPKEQAALGNAWWDQAEKEKGLAKARLQWRGYFWYRQAAPLLEAKARGDIEKRIALVVKDNPALTPYTSGFIRAFEGHSEPVNGVALSVDNQHALSASVDKTARLWDVRRGKELRRLVGHTAPLWGVVYSPNGRQALTCSKDGTIRLWDLENGGQEVRQFKGHDDEVNCVVFSRDGRYALSGSDDQTLRLWDVATGKEVRQFKGHKNTVTSVALSPDGRRAVSTSTDQTMRLWDVDKGTEIRELKGHTSYVTSAVFSPDGAQIISGSADNSVRVWDANTGKQVGKMDGHKDNVTSVAVSLDGQRVLSGSWDGTVILWDLHTGKELFRFGNEALAKALGQANPGKVLSNVRRVALSADGRLALVGGSGEINLFLLGLPK
jgi:hypothetical protein